MKQKSKHRLSSRRSLLEYPGRRTVRFQMLGIRTESCQLHPIGIERHASRSQLGARSIARQRPNRMEEYCRHDHAQGPARTCDHAECVTGPTDAFIVPLLVRSVHSSEQSLHWVCSSSGTCVLSLVVTHPTKFSPFRAESEDQATHIARARLLSQRSQSALGSGERHVRPAQSVSTHGGEGRTCQVSASTFKPCLD